MKQSNGESVRVLRALHLSPEDREALEEGALLMDPEELDAALVGVIRDVGGASVAVYSYQGLVDAFASLFVAGGDEDPVENAEEWVQYNTLRALSYTPDGPIVVSEYDADEDPSEEEQETLDVAGKTWLVIARSPPSKPSPAPPRRGEEEEEESKMPSRKPNAAFMATKTPSPELAAVVGSKPLPRPQVVKKLWEYIHEHNLQNPENRRNILCDAKFKAIFGKREVSMTEMNKLLSAHLS